MKTKMMNNSSQEEMLQDIEFLLHQLKLMEWAQDDDGIKEIERKYFDPKFKSVRSKG